ncbi:MAG: penicillin-binding transpeptidase domain-containing protein [Gemmatimonadales bacterium]
MAKPTVRLTAVQAAFVVAIFAIIARAAQVQLIKGKEYSRAAKAQQTDQVVLPARRGTIYDRNGLVLALTVENFHVGVAPNELRHPKRDAVEIARQLGIPRTEVQRQLLRHYAYFRGPFSSAAVQPLHEMKGVHLSSELARFYPGPDLARPIIGWPATKDRQAAGIERMLDSVLTGVDGKAVVLRDRNGRRYESPARLGAFPVPGSDVYLTLDAGLQEIVEDALSDALQRLDAVAGDVVVLNPHTGEILAVASRTMDGRSTANAFTSVFEPGSSAKVFVAAALLSKGLAKLADTVDTEGGTYVMRYRTIEDEHPSQRLSLQEVIEQSSNIGIVKFARALTPAEQFRTLRDFGLGTPTGVEYPSESQGILRRPNTWSKLTSASLAMGYEIAVTPLQLAQAYAVIANDGVLVRPTLIKEVRSYDGRITYQHVTEPVRRAITPEVAAKLRTALRGVVYRGGTGETAALTSYEVGGKTGTAKRAGPGGYIPGSYTANFTSLFPGDSPQLVMVVKLDDPRGAFARVTAAPLTRLVLEQILAAETDALDRGRLSRPSSAAGRPSIEPGESTRIQVLRWPLRKNVDSVRERSVPDVTGLTPRAAALKLHGVGLRMHLMGWGPIVSSTPPSGTTVPLGTVVGVTGSRQKVPSQWN